MPQPRNLKAICGGGAILVMVLLCLGWYWLRPSPISPQVVWLPLSAPGAKTAPNWIQKIKYQYQALKWKLLGSSQGIALDFKYLSAPASLNLSQLKLPPQAFAGSNGLCAWIPAVADSKAIQALLQQTPGAQEINHPYLTSMSGIDCAMWTGADAVINGATQSLGFGLECTPIRARGGTQTRLGLHVTEAITVTNPNTLQTNKSIRTNLVFACQMQIPQGHDGIIIQPPSPAMHDQYLIVIVHAENAR